MKKVLYKSADIRREIARIFSMSKGRRVAITAFVGDGAEAFLRRPEGIELICWPKAGGTNPNALRELIRRKVKVFFADSLHMKVYWTEDCGAVITSANLSTNALGAGDLRELGVCLSCKEVDIDRIISSIKPRLASPSELRALDRQHKLYAAQNRFISTPKSRRATFDVWYESYSRAEWKLFSWENYVTPSQVAQQITREEYGAKFYHSSIGAQGGDYQKGDWILHFRTGKKSITEIGWMYSDFIVRVPRSDKKAYNPTSPYELVQVSSLRHYEPPPFQADRRFKSAFVKAIIEYGLPKIDNLKSAKPPVKLIDMVYNHHMS